MIPRPNHAESEDRGILRDLASDLRIVAERVIHQPSLDCAQRLALLDLLVDLPKAIKRFDGEGK